MAVHDPAPSPLATELTKDSRCKYLCDGRKVSCCCSMLGKNDSSSGDKT
jgi:hypothetical protein